MSQERRPPHPATLERRAVQPAMAPARPPHPATLERRAVQPAMARGKPAAARGSAAVQRSEKQSLLRPVFKDIVIDSEETPPSDDAAWFGVHKIAQLRGLTPFYHAFLFRNGDTLSYEAFFNIETGTDSGWEKGKKSTFYRLGEVSDEAWERGQEFMLKLASMQTYKLTGKNCFSAAYTVSCHIFGLEIPKEASGYNLNAGAKPMSEKELKKVMSFDPLREKQKKQSFIGLLFGSKPKPSSKYDKIE